MSLQTVIDPLRFVAQGQPLEGRLSVVGLERLTEGLAPDADLSQFEVVYRLLGSRSGNGDPLLDLHVSGVFPMVCQRCLAECSVSIDERLRYRLVAGLDDDAVTQEELEDDDLDYLELTPSLDLHELIEDELILALPSVPRHVECGLPAVTVGGSDRKEASPFGVLLNLKKPSGKTH